MKRINFSVSPLRQDTCDNNQRDERDPDQDCRIRKRIVESSSDLFHLGEVESRSICGLAVDQHEVIVANYTNPPFNFVELDNLTSTFSLTPILLTWCFTLSTR